MKLPKRISEKADSKLVQRINELYHDLENVYYDDYHADILHFEESFWIDAAKKFLVKDKPIVCLDYGTGTGFIPLIVGKYLKKDDNLICADISSEMLRVCENNLTAKPVPCKCSYCKIDGQTIPLADNSVDAITVNSVLHHLFGLKHFAEECARVLKPSGLLLVSHEPNKSPALPFPGNALVLSANLLMRPQMIFFKTAENIPFMEKLMRAVLGKVSESYRRRNKMLSEIAEQLKKEKLIDFDLRGTEIQQIVDIHTQYGFDMQELFTNIFNKFEPVEFETFNHLGFFPANKLTETIDRYLRKNWPAAGKGIRFIMRKKN